MNEKKEKDLQQILEIVNVAKLPKSWDASTSKRIWVDAILEIRKADCSTSYAYAYNQYGRDPKYAIVLGNASIIARIESIHPLNYLSKDFLPVFSNREDIIDYVCKSYKADVEKIQALTDEEIKTLAVNNAVEQQIMFMKENKRK